MTRFLLSIAALLAALALAGCGGSSSHHATTTRTATRPRRRRTSTTAIGHLSPTSPGLTPAHRPNIVFVLTDDLSMDLLRYMPQVQSMQREGETFDDYFVTDSLCCPSRSSIFTGDFPHDTGVYTNSGKEGGLNAFYAHDDEEKGFNVFLQRAGYRTAMMGKYLNGYMAPNAAVPDRYVPPGWNEWDVTGDGYPEFNYTLNEDGTLHHYGHKPSDYLVNVMARRGAGFVRSMAGSRQPFFLELATFAPHRPYTPAPRYAGTYRGLSAPHPPSYDKLPTNPPSWLAGHRPLGPAEMATINRAFDRRVEAVQSVDDMIARIRAALRATGQLKNTYIVFSSDNGLHMGEYRLMPGKLTAFDTDIHVPLVIDGPGIRAGTVTRAMTENTDLAPTFERIGHTRAPCDGQALQPLFHGGTPAGWRDAVLVEHHGPDEDFAVDPDAQHRADGDPTSYEAIRTPGYTYVQYDDGQHEFYDLRTDPYELENVYDELTARERAGLRRALRRMRRCHGHRACWAAEHVHVPT